LVEEREALSVLAAFDRRDVPAADALADAFEKRFPKSLFKAAIKAAREKHHAP
jgi:hypothetical protein